MGIAKLYPEISQDFNLMGCLSDGNWENFALNKDYIAFLIKLK
jgi:hypothetical protein